MVEEKKTKKVAKKVTEEKPKVEEKKVEKMETEKVEEKKPVKVEKVTKEIAVANGRSLRISPKYSFAICKILRGKTPEQAIARLTEVVEMRRAVPMRGLEVAHQKGKGMAGGKFPQTAAKAFIEVIKQLKANAENVGIETPVITIAKADAAAAPFRRGGRKQKRTHVHLEAKDKTKLAEKKK